MIDSDTRHSNGDRRMRSNGHRSLLSIVKEWVS